MKQSVARWGAAAIDAGWTLIPSTLLKYQQRLEISPTELNVILQILKHWWNADDLPYPSQTSIADSMGVHKSTVERALKALRTRKLVTTKHRFDERHGQKSNFYSFDGLIEEITKLAEEDLKEKKRRQNEDAKRRSPKPKYGHGLSVA